jgi:hypothetical protein
LSQFSSHQNKSNYKSYLFVLVGSDCNKFGLLENIRSKGGVGQFEDVIGPDEVEPGLVFVHRVEDRL